MSALIPVVSVDTHEERLEAIQAYPTLWKYALEGNHYYMSRIAQTHVAWAFMAWAPWRWNN